MSSVICRHQHDWDGRTDGFLGGQVVQGLGGMRGGQVDSGQDGGFFPVRRGVAWRVKITRDTLLARNGRIGFDEA